MGHPIHLINLTDEIFSLNIEEISNILDKIFDKNVAIVSINGNKRNGKSFLLNFLLRYLKYNKSFGNQWINGVNEETLDGFHWRGGAERDTVGIWMWSEPYIVKDKYGNDIALLLLDTQGNFDEQTTFQESSIIISVSLLLSSTLILNIMRNISEDNLQFVEFFPYFQESFRGDTNTREKLFQRLQFVVRDWQNQGSYSFGHHNDSIPVEKNYHSDVIIPKKSQNITAQTTRREILANFQHVSCFLMPHPGLDVFDESFRGEPDLINTKFIENVSKFVPLILSSENIETKNVCGKPLTGQILKAYLTKLSRVLQYNRLPEVKQLIDATLKECDSLAVFANENLSTLSSNSENSKNFIDFCSLGSGAFSTVFKCRNKIDNNFYAIKKISFEEKKRKKVCIELEILSKLNSNYVVKYIHSWIEHNYYINFDGTENLVNSKLNDLLFSREKTQLLHIQMELCSLTLRDAINIIEQQCMDTSFDNTLSPVGYYISSELLYEVLECVDYLHSQSPAIIHRDLKPENILINNFTNNRFVKLSDFGLSTFHEFADQSHTKYTGTINYRAIELNSTKYTTKADIYSLGVILQELLHIDINDTDRKCTPVLEKKMNYMRTLVEKLLSLFPIKRPNCNEILLEKSFWLLSTEEVLSDDQLMNFFSISTKVDTIEDHFIKYFIHTKFKNLI